MTTDILQVRERALEYEFCHKIDEELWRKLRERVNSDNRRRALAVATGIKDERVLDELVASEINGETIMALSLFPLVWIAWADGHIEPDERAAILASAEAAGLVRESASYHMIEVWLDHRPKSILQTAWKDYVHYLAKTMPPAVFQAFKKNALRRAHELADSICFRYGFHHVESVQDAILDQLVETFRYKNCA